MITESGIALDISCDNTPRQQVIGGTQAALNEFATLLMAAGYEPVKLGVSGAWHAFDGRRRSGNARLSCRTGYRFARASGSDERNSKKRGRSVNYQRKSLITLNSYGEMD